MKKKISLEDELEEANYFIDYYTEQLFDTFKKQNSLIEEARKVLESKQKPSKELIKKVKKNQRKINGMRANLKYLNDVQMYLEDQIEFSKLF